MLRWLLLLLALAAPASAQILPPAGANAIQPELVAESSPAPGGTVELAILMHTRPGWHGYWLNPGDAGLPMQVDWKLPPGWRVDTLRYPVPGRLTISGIVNYVYDKAYAVLTRLTAPAGAASSGEIRAKMRWLACTDEICVPERGEVSLVVPVGQNGSADRRFDDWRRALPHPIAAAQHYAMRGDRLEVSIPLPASVALGEPYFFPADDGPVDYAAPQRFRRAGDVLVADLKAGRAAPSGAFHGVLALGDGRGLEITATPGPIPAGGTALNDASAPGGRAILLAVLGAILGGMLLNLMPCVFPILALKALHLARSGGSPGAARRDELAYAAGAVVGTGALGAVLLVLRAGGRAAGWAFQLQDPRAIVVLLLLATAITLNLLRTFELPVVAGEANPRGSFGTGALAAFVATPCAGPFLGAALGTALLLPPAASIAVFAALGFGLALPFVLFAFVPALVRLMPKPGPWMARLQRILAVPMAVTVLACLWLLWRQAGLAALVTGIVAVAALALLLVWTGRRQASGGAPLLATLIGAVVLAAAAITLLPATSTASANVPAGTERWSEAAVARHVAKGDPVFVYFTADWCLTCKVNEAGAIDRDEVQAAFRKAHVKTLVGDWTDGDPAITRFLDQRQRAAVPLYLWYAPGATEPEELPQVLTPSLLIAKASQPR